jgi:hypothetical protein
MASFQIYEAASDLVFLTRSEYHPNNSVGLTPYSNSSIILVKSEIPHLVKILEEHMNAK